MALPDEHICALQDHSSVNLCRLAEVNLHAAPGALTIAELAFTCMVYRKTPGRRDAPCVERSDRLSAKLTGNHAQAHPVHFGECCGHLHQPAGILRAPSAGSLMQ